MSLQVPYKCSSAERVATITCRKHIPSFVTIQGEQSLVSYRNQIQSCRHCNKPLHPGYTCVQSKNLIKRNCSAESENSNAQPSLITNDDISTRQAVNIAPCSYASVTANKRSTHNTKPEQTTQQRQNDTASAERNKSLKQKQRSRQQTTLSADRSSPPRKKKDARPPHADVAANDNTDESDMEINAADPANVSQWLEWLKKKIVENDEFLKQNVIPNM